MKGQKFKEAETKYTKALENLKSPAAMAAAGAERDTLMTQCQSNLALCHLKQGQNEDCVTTCNEILSRDGKAVKALFRRPLLQPHIAKHLEGVTGLKPE